MQIRTLFVLKGKQEGLSPFVSAQVESIRRLGVEVDVFLIKGNGYFSYLKEAFRLRKYLKKSNYDILHAHYGLSGWTTVLAFSKLPVVLSLMGSDILGEYQEENSISFKSRIVVLLTKFLQFFVDSIIAKSDNINNCLNRKSISKVIPNGVELDKVCYTGVDYREELGMDVNKKYVLFLGNPEDRWKNFPLAKESIELINDNSIELIAPFPVNHSMVVKYLNAANVFLHTSFMEGSSNVIKEAMACDCPIVYTDVGDAKWVVGETEGCYMTDFELMNVVDKIRTALSYSALSGRTQGMKRILKLGLDSESIAKKIISIYRSNIS